MPRTILMRPRARADLNAIWDHTVATWSQAQAERYVSGLGATLDLLAEFPETARLREEFSPPVRLHLYRAHFVVFTDDDTRIEVIRVLHARSDWRRALGD
ncbi:plasmid stabilization protein ParE [Salipiger pallidus]|uniref:Toxin n=1 Tax=Salipiger pallidus TaxID=1775170 RepID=A0A8J3EIE8_9RHOB|nr:type II toxin-antitoxin system RelE/ParE family toxin [Salipiger pallidus]GGG84814.1 plasmid stabilization protein ParE [Salipiger pallidus]